MPKLSERVASASSLAWALVKEPNQTRYLPDWWRARRHPAAEFTEPWWPRPALEYVAEQLTDGSRVFEFGSGGSTRWLTGLGASVISIEHDESWYRTVSQSVPAAAEVKLIRPSAHGTIGSPVMAGFFDEYIASIAEYPAESFDLVIVDGRARVACGLAAIPQVKPGGLLLLDDSQRPRYRPLVERLQGWSRRDVRGLKPAEVEVARTTIWRKPA